MKTTTYVVAALAGALWLSAPALSWAQDAAPAPEAAAAPAMEELSQAELNRIISGGDNADEINRLRFYGFGDVTFDTGFHSEDSKLQAAFDNRGQFSVGNLNLFMEGRLSDKARTLTEVRFTYLPHGGKNFYSSDPPIRTDMRDYTNNLSFMRWGGIIINRAFLEYSFDNLAILRVGQFRTPVGIWNEDHASPTIIGAMVPYMIAVEFFPRKQTGLDLSGQTSVGSVVLGYHLTMSNGRGPFDETQDLDHQFGFGGRVFANTSVLGNLTLGLSGYGGRFTDRTAKPTFDAQGQLIVPFVMAQQYDERSYGADLRWEWNNLTVISEAMVNDVKFTDKGRPLASTLPGVTALRADGKRTAVYGILGYTLPWYGIMPFVMSEYYDLFASDRLDSLYFVTGGLNVRVQSNLVVKGQYTSIRFSGPRAESPFAEDDLNYVMFQVAWAY